MGEVPFDNLLRVWGVVNPTQQERTRIQQELADAGVAAHPPLDRLERYSNTTLWVQQPVGFPPSQAPAPQAQAPSPAPDPAASRGTPGASPATLIALVLIAVGSLLGVASLFLHWTPNETLWELFTILDVVTVLLGLATVALCARVLAAPRTPLLRAALVPLAMFFSLPTLVTTVEFVAAPGGIEAGHVVGFLGALVAAAGLAALVVGELTRFRSERRSGMPVVLIGLGAAVFVALFVSVAQLLPAIEGFGLDGALSEWEFAKFTDWVDQLAVFALLGLAVATVVVRRPALVLLLGVALSYFALPDFLLAIDDFANGGRLFVADVVSFISGAVALGASLFLLANALSADE
jgi:hypothetical protein